MEKFELYNKNVVSLRKMLPQGDQLFNDEYVLAVHACVFNKEGQMLIRQCSEEESLSTIWMLSASGYVRPGEDSREMIRRIIQKELGIPRKSAAHFSMQVKYHGVFNDFYLICSDLNLEALPASHRKNDRVRWANQKEVLALLNQDCFVGYDNKLIENLFCSGEAYARCRHQQYQRGIDSKNAMPLAI